MSAAVPIERPDIEVLIAKPEQYQEVSALLEEYFEAIGVVVRDTPATIDKYLRDARSGVWLAYYGGAAVGCILLRPLRDRNGEVKRLYVTPDCRRLGLAKALLTALEAHAAASGYDALYLDSKDDLKEAQAFYRRSGYELCERYNDNPQATVFMKKTLREPLTVRDFRHDDADAFFALNEAWISKLFKLEPKDFETLREPEKYILSKGGRIYMACRGTERVGCCALLNMGDGVYEVAKMGVAEAERGKGAGRALLEYAKSDARRLGARRLYLETNHTLKNAIHLYESVGFRHLKPEEIKPSPYARADVYMDLELI